MIIAFFVFFCYLFHRILFDEQWKLQFKKSMSFSFFLFFVRRGKTGCLISMFYVLIVFFLPVMVWRRNSGGTCTRTLSSSLLSFMIKATFMVLKNIGNSSYFWFNLLSIFYWYLVLWFWTWYLYLKVVNVIVIGCEEDTFVLKKERQK